MHWASGGDQAPPEILLDAVLAKRALEIDLVLVGKRAQIESELREIEAANQLGLPGFEIVDAPRSSSSTRTLPLTPAHMSLGIGA